jgi:hypothetical protein
MSHMFGVFEYVSTSPSADQPFLAFLRALRNLDPLSSDYTLLVYTVFPDMTKVGGCG